MPTQDDFPDIWACESDRKHVKVEIAVPETRPFDSTLQASGYDWIEIPTTSVEQWNQKGEAAEVQRTVKVEYPGEWGDDSDTVRHNSPRRLIENFDPTEMLPYQEARVWLKDPNGSWVLTHYGWIGGAGPTGDQGYHKFWIYDMSEFFGATPVSETFSGDTLYEIFDDLGDLVADETPIPIIGSVIVPPTTVEELTDLLSALGLEATMSREEMESVIAESVDEDTSAATVYRAVEEAEVGDRPTVASGVDRSEINVPIEGTKTFEANHDTLHDVMNWFERRTGCTIFFEPRPDGVVLVADIQKDRRLFVQDDVVRKDLQGDDDRSVSHVTKVLLNDALYEMKPLNTIEVRGETSASQKQAGSSGLVADERNLGSSLTSTRPESKEYPVVKVQHPALVEAANGIELSGEIVESDAATLDKAENEAIDALRKRLEEPSEGHIVLEGTPRIMPFDGLESFETCDDYVAYEQTPVRYEIESVKHEIPSEQDLGFTEGLFETTVHVSVWSPQEDFETVKKTMIEVKD